MLQKKSKNPVLKLVLASGSPRRAQLLKAAGLRYSRNIPHIRERKARGESPKKMTLRLAQQKAQAVATRKRSNNCVILAADTIVVHPNGNSVLGKPASQSEAKKMIKILQNKTHQVITGYALLKIINGKIVRTLRRAVSTRVTIRSLSKSEVEDYVMAGESMDKAGAYAAQGTGMTIIEKISGSYTNVVGLPIAELIRDLKELNFERS